MQRKIGGENRLFRRIFDLSQAIVHAHNSFLRDFASFCSFRWQNGAGKRKRLASCKFSLYFLIHYVAFFLCYRVDGKQGWRIAMLGVTHGQKPKGLFWRAKQRILRRYVGRMVQQKGLQRSGTIGGNKSGIFIFYAGRRPRAPSACALALSSYLLLDKQNIVHPWRRKRWERRFANLRKMMKKSDFNGCILSWRQRILKLFEHELSRITHEFFINLRWNSHDNSWLIHGQFVKIRVF